MDELSKHDPTLYGLIGAKVDEFIANAEGEFNLYQVYDWCDAKDGNLKAAVRMALRRRKDKTIKASGGRAGCYRRYEKDFTIIDLSKIENLEPLDVRLPLGLHNLGVEIYEKDVVAISGTPNQGKTCFEIEGARLNMNKFECFYFSTEMSARAFVKRISKHHDTILKDWTIKFIESFNSCEDVIQQDAMNFIDYIEPPEGEYYKIPSIISGIQRRLNKGVAFVALQKNPGTSHGVGGPQTLAKPAVFLTLENNVCKIQKVKNFNGVNPNGYTAQFKIVDGINLSRVGNWEPP
jgi:hypothetical protein